MPPLNIQFHRKTSFFSKASTIDKAQGSPKPEVDSVNPRLKFSSTVRHTLLIGCCFVIIPATNLLAADSVYRWVDDNGVTHYGESPPENTNKQVDLIRTRKDYSSDAKTARAAREEKRITLEKEQTQTTHETQINSEAEALIAERSKKIEENCKAAKQNLNVLTTHGRVREKGPNGEANFLNEEQHQERIRETTRYIHENCNHP